MYCVFLFQQKLSKAFRVRPNQEFRLLYIVYPPGLEPDIKRSVEVDGHVIRLAQERGAKKIPDSNTECWGTRCSVVG
jgi:hypothetical protein